MRVFLSGASGCVGHYVLERLLEGGGHALTLLLRDPGRLRADLANHPRVRILSGNLREPGGWESELADCEALVHLAAAWGGEKNAPAVNRDATRRLLSRLDPGVCRHVLCFSTASVLDAKGAPLPAAGALGTPYIRSKYEALLEAERGPLADRTTLLFPTLVLGGDAQHPRSHFSKLIREIAKRAWLARFFTADGSFQFIHAADLATVVEHLLDRPPRPGPQRVILGCAGVSADAALSALCRRLGYRRPLRIPISPPLAEGFIRLFRIRLAAWDRYCMQQRHFVYAGAVSPADFGLPVHCGNLEEALRLALEA